jgi:hypothetical protein
MVGCDAPERLSPGRARWYDPRVTRRHAAALALLGWYLMIPPDDEGRILPDAPLSTWVKSGSYDRAVECDKDLARAKEKPPREKDSLAKMIELEFTMAVCVSSDDPRLAK